MTGKNKKHAFIFDISRKNRTFDNTKELSGRHGLHLAIKPILKTKNAMDKMITQENFEDTYVDSIEMARIDKFVCDEMARQIHRYIKAMKGSKSIMLKFEEQLATLSVAEKEEAIARYIDLNRKVLSGLDFKIVLARAMANYCDTFSYLLQLVNNKRKMVFYLNRIREKYEQYHEVFEQNGRFGIKNHHGKVLLSAAYDFLRTPYVYVDDLRTLPVIAQKDGKMGLVLPDGHDTVVAEFVYDDIALRDEPPYFEATKGGQYGVIDANGAFTPMERKTEEEETEE